jgi:preprotein translocase subunit YajC
MMRFAIRPVVALTASPNGGGAWLQLVPFVLVLGIFYFIILLPMRRKQQKVQAFLEGLKVNEKVVTTGGIYGRIMRLNDKTVHLQIADKTQIEVSRAAIGGYQGQEPVVEAENRP